MLHRLGLPARGRWVSQWEQTKTVGKTDLEVLEPIPALFLGTGSMAGSSVVPKLLCQSCCEDSWMRTGVPALP